MKKSAFTLAEVLITLGIIGIIAAMTFPTLIAGYQKKVWVAQLQKSVNILENGFLMMKADAGVDKLSETGMWNIEGLKKYFVFLGGYGPHNTTYRWTALNLSSMLHTTKNYYILADGMLLYFTDFWTESAALTPATCKRIKSYGGKVCSMAGWVYIDVNGFKKPNQNGRDVFKFFISDEGQLYPDKGKDAALFSYSSPLESNTMYWRNSRFACGNPDEPVTPNVRIIGDGCAARIIENGWKMDY